MITHFHKSNHLGYLLLFFSLLAGITKLSAQQNTYLYGPTTANVNDIKYYYLNDPYGDIDIYSIFWYADGIIQGTDYGTTYIDVLWNYASPYNYVYVDFQDHYWNYYYEELDVNVTSSAPPTPGNPIIQSSNCGYSTLQRSGSPPSGVTWYWQGKTYNGTSTSKGSGSTFIANEGTGTYYIRARNSNGTWSTGSGSRYVTITQPSTWYQDQDGDGFGDANNSQSACSQPSGYVSNSNDNCPDYYSLVNNGCDVNCNAEDINRVVSKVYDANGILKGYSKSYFNTLGKSIQTQSLDIKTNKVWATNTLYDSHGRSAFQSLSAPVNTNCLLYNQNFIKNSNGGNYSISDFENNPESPSTVGTQTNTLGHYYSTSNTGELYQDITSYPFSRTIYSKLNPGAVKKVIGGNKVTVNGATQWAQGYSFSMPVAQELHYAFGTDQFPSQHTGIENCTEPPYLFSGEYMYDLTPVNINDCMVYYPGTIYNVMMDEGEQEFELNKIYKIDISDYDNGFYDYDAYYQITGRTSGIDWSSNKEAYVYCGGYSTCSEAFLTADYINATKTITRDVHGVETVVFTDSDGNTLAAARSGNEDYPARKKYKVVSPINEQGFVDIHIPVGCGGTVNFIGGNTNGRYNVYDLITENKTVNNTTANSVWLNPGVYRIEETTGNYNNPLPYVKIDGSTISLIDSANQVGVEYYVNYYDYSLNFYDKAGRLTQSVQPEGFDDDLNLTTPTRNHTLTSTFTYNSLGQLLDTTSPDEGTAEFLYRKDGQIRYSQNAKQAALSTKEISYTNYDDYGRSVESGVIATNTTFSSLNPDAVSLPSGTKKEQHFTIYDELDTSGMHAALSASGISSGYYPKQSFVAGNVSKTHTANPTTSTTWYSYDIYGRVEWIIQKIEGLGTKTINYTYDAITGAVTKVDYQKNKSTERYIHKYTYNIADELIKVETSTNDVSYTTQAEYEYYETGALKRTEIAEDLQGIDYVYNINGQLKAINSPQGSGFKDPGNDSPTNNGFKNDVFGMLIDYHDKDYSRTGTIYNGLKNVSTNDQLNGNIGSIRWHNSTSAPGSSNIDTYKYQYNKNNWLKQADFGVSNASSSVSYTQNSNNDYQVSNLTYDANGNIKTLKRNKHYQSGNAMDNLTYNYDSTKKNQLKRIIDAAGNAANANDIYTQVNANNYVYNQIGQLIENKEEQLKYYYNTSGLVTEIKKNNLSLVKFFYNDRGHRVKKEIYTNGSLTRNDYYVRDAAGSIMAVYEDSTVKEHTIYGASRLGVYYRTSGTNVYQLTDHLGNVRAVVMKNGSNALSVTNKTDYYPFGMPMPNRNVEGNYRYKYQGQEKDPETGKEAFELRLWDSRIGRWLTTDPYGQYHSPYLGMGNNPISQIDPDGGMSGPGDGCDGCIQLDEVVITAKGNGSGRIKPRGITWTSEITEFAGNMAQWQELTNHQFSTDPSLARDQWEVSYGDSYTPLSQRTDLWRIDATGFAENFDAGWNSWDPDGLGNSLMKFTSIGIGGSLLLPLASGAGLGTSFSGLGAPVINGINYSVGAAQYYTASAYMSVNTYLSVQLSSAAGAAATLNYRYGYQLHNYLTGYKGVHQSLLPTIEYKLNIELVPFLHELYNIYDDVSSFGDD